MITIASGCSRLISRSTSRPEPSGRSMSSKTAAGNSAWNCFIASAVEPASTVAKPQLCTASRSVQRIASSSSTTRICSFVFLGDIIQLKPGIDQIASGVSIYYCILIVWAHTLLFERVMCAATTSSSLVKPAREIAVPGQTDWHALEVNVVLSSLDVDPKSGLTTTEVTERRARSGPNALQRIQARPAWRVLVDQFASIVIALLAIAAAIAWAMGDGAEAIAILIVLVLNAAVGFATEWQAGRALEALRRQSRMSSRVRREGFETTVDAEELVPGDIIIL